jgi:TetR/AcrR family transcriptional repressor of nem operon
MNTASEFAGRDHVASILVSRATLRFVDVFQMAIERGQEEGVISRQKAAGALALYLISSIAGLRTMIKADADPESVNEIISVIASSLD